MRPFTFAPAQTETNPVFLVVFGVLFFVLAAGAPLVGAKLRMVLPRRAKTATIASSVASLFGLIGLVSIFAEAIAVSG